MLVKVPQDCTKSYYKELLLFDLLAHLDKSESERALQVIIVIIQKWSIFSLMVLIAFVRQIEASVLNREHFIASLKFLVVHLNTALDDHMYLVVCHYCQHTNQQVSHCHLLQAFVTKTFSVATAVIVIINAVFF